jgi:ankyrin repeat protein
VDVCNLLIELGADVNELGGYRGLSPLYGAALSGHADVCELLIARGAHVDGYSVWPPLHVACHHGHVSVCKVLIAHGANINALNYDGQTPLQATCAFCDIPGIPEHAHAVVRKLLIASGAQGRPLRPRKSKKFV